MQLKRTTSANTSETHTNSQPSDGAGTGGTIYSLERGQHVTASGLVLGKP